MTGRCVSSAQYWTQLRCADCPAVFFSKQGTLAAVQWYRDNLVGKKVINRDTGWEIGFTLRGATKSVNAKGHDPVRLIPALEQVIELSTFISTAPDIYNRPKTKAVHKFAARAMLDGKPKNVVATVREDQDGRMHYDPSRDMGAVARFAKKSTAGRGDTLPDPALDGSVSTIVLLVKANPIKHQVGAGLSRE